MKVSKAIVNDRRIKIMRQIEEKRSVSVDELVEKYHVSPITIRRDLQYWEDKGAIIRNYGGASLIQEFVEDDEYERTTFQKAIAKRAALYIEEDDVIFINSSTTALMIVDYIKDKHVTIITNNARAINYTPDPKVLIIFTGGEVRFPKNSMTGDFAVAALNNITATKCFVGCSGLTENGISTGLMKEMLINQTMIKRTSGQRFVLCDSTKIGVSYSFFYSSLKGFDYLITDVKADDEVIEKVKENTGINVIKVEAMKGGWKI